MSSQGSDVVMFEERLGAPKRAWVYLPVLAVVTAFAVAPVFVPIAVGSWFVNVLRFRNTTVRIDREVLTVGRREVRLAALELSTLGRAGNTWPWRVFSKRYLGANPFWTRDSVGIRGIASGRPVWVAVGTDRREELVDTLNRAVHGAQQTASPVDGGEGAARRLPPPSWHPDPWEPSGRLRWWDGTQWSGYTSPRRTDAPPGVDPTSR